MFTPVVACVAVCRSGMTARRYGPAGEAAACIQTVGIVRRARLGAGFRPVRAFLVFSGQSIFHVSRERQYLWHSLPGKWLIVSSVIDVSIITLLATQGRMMHPIPIGVVSTLFCAAIV